MTLVRFLKAHARYRAGEEVWIADDATAAALADGVIAERIDEGGPSAVATPVSAEADEAEASAPSPRGIDRLLGRT